MGMKHLVALILIAGMAFSSWSQVINITAVDINGAPAEGADILITYQKSNRFLENDGTLAGRTDADGKFNAYISNVVPDVYHNTAIEVQVSHYYGGSERRVEQAGPEPKKLDFSFPFKVAPLKIHALSIEGLPLENVTVFLSGITVKKETGTDGSAGFSVLEGEAFSGFATFQNKTVTFDSSEAKEEQGAMTITLDIPVRKIPENANAKKKITLNLRLNEVDGKPLAGQEVKFLFFGEESSAKTDSAGLVAFGTDESGPLRVTVWKNEYNYSRQYNISASKNESFTLPRLMKLNSFRYVKEPEENCYLVLANVTDPRLSVPRQGKLIRLLRGFNTSQGIGMDENGYFSARICVTAGLSVIMNISNRYEFVTTSPLYLPWEPPRPPPNMSSSSKEPDITEIGLSITAFLMVGGFFAALILRRKQAQRGVQYVLTYFRQVVMKLIGADKRKKPTPKVAAPLQQAKPKDEITQKIEATKEEELEKKDAQP